jgi:transposase-like protein
MAKRSQFKMSVQERRNRTFSEGFKKGKVKDIEEGLSTISEVCKAYEVSNTAVYRWLKAYGTNQEKKERMVVESQSDTHSLLLLKQKVAELERLLGQKQVLLEFQNKLIDLAEETYGIDIKKKSSLRPSGTSGDIESSIHSV